MKKILMVFITSLLLAICFSTAVFANSSWQWISETRPYDVLPFVMGGTLIIEIFSIYLLTGIRQFKKIGIIVLLGNLVSFILPYINALFDPIYNFGKMMENTPFYIVGTLYLLLTLVAEVPINYCCLRKYTEQKRKLLIVIFLVNIVTTVLVAVVEHIFCRGYYM